MKVVREYILRVITRNNYIFFSISSSVVLYEMMDVYYAYCSNGLMIHVSRIIVTPLKLIQGWISCSVVSDSETPRTVDHNLLCPWDSPRQEY